MDNTENVDEYTKKVAQVLRERQAQSGISYRAIAAQTGYGLSTINRIFNGQRAITINYLNAIGEVLEFAPWEILNEADRI